MSLSNYALRLAEQGKHLESVAHSARAHALYVQLAKRLPLRYADDEYHARFSLALWRWLMNGQVMEEVLAQDVPELAARAQCVAHFQRGVLQCLDAAATETGAATMCSYSESALAQWLRMDAGQQQSWQALFLLFAALAHHKVGVDAATRCGFVLGSD